MDRITLSQQIQLHVYDTAADMPSEFQQIMTKILQAWPQTLLALSIGFGIIGLIFLYRYIIRKYHKEEDFWRYFATINCILALGLTGYVISNIRNVQVWLTNSTIEISIVKDESLTATVDSSLYVRKGWRNGHNVLASNPNPITAVAPANSVYASELASSGITMSLARADGTVVDLSQESQFLDAIITGTDEPSDYQIIIAVNDDTDAGEYEGDAQWVVDPRDTIMSVATAQRYADTSGAGAAMGKCEDNRIGFYFDPADIPTEAAYRSGECPDFHNWLNAPHPIYRENIKSISFKDAKPKTPYDPVAKTGDSNCWDISEHQSKKIVACYTERRGNMKVGDLQGFGISFAADVLQGIADALADAGCWVSSLFGGCQEGTQEQLVIAEFGLQIYDIVISQEGGVTAPTDSSHLFFYTGQNTDYFLLNRFLIPRDNSREWLDLVVVQLAGQNIPIIGSLISAIEWAVNAVIDTVDKGVIADTKICTMTKHYPFGYSPRNKECTEGWQNTFIDFSNFHVDNVINMSSMFEGANFNELSSRLEKIKEKTGKVTDMSDMFKNNNDITSFTVRLDTSSVEDFSGIFKESRFGECDFRDGDRTCSDKDGTIDIGFHAARYLNDDPNSMLISKEKPAWNTSSATNMSNMFANARGAYKIHISGIDTSNVEDMSFMFMSTMPSSLDFSSFNTSKVESMAGMFSGARVKSLDLTGFDTSSTKNMSQMFENLYNDMTPGELDLSKFNTSNVVTMADMFSGSNITVLDLTGFDTSSVADMSHMFFSLQAGNTTVDLSSFNTDNVTNMSWMFANFNPNIQTEFECVDGVIEYPKDSEGNDITNRKGPDIMVPFSNSVIQDQRDTFWTSFGDFVKSIFSSGGNDEAQCGDPSDNERIDNYGSYHGRFSTAILNLTNFNTRNVTNMAGMFTGSKSDRVTFTPAATAINDEGEEVSVGFDTSRVTDMSWMFAGLSYSPIIRVPLDTSKVIDMTGMFAGMSTYDESHSLDLTSFSTTSKPDMSWMFALSCIGTEILVSDQFEIPVPIDDNDHNEVSKTRFMFAKISNACTEKTNYATNVTHKTE